ncbi:MAG: hypothetical protein LH702_26335, partial [Phormidesmis sp. CAN_BIN44]|nr:hypothetical protein [Phormidesmis sp. CAN_BIN44]
MSQTGHRFDLTWQALRDEGFAQTATQVTQVQNWLVDYFSSSPTSGSKDELSKLHFDNLSSVEQINNYWQNFTVNTRNAIQQATREGDALKFLSILGMSLHAVQDFYAHSTWVETHTPYDETFRTDTWFDNLPTQGMELYTGYYPDDDDSRFTPRPHGDDTYGVNHDSPFRPGWNQSYVFSYAAYRQWVNAVQTWASEINPQFWEQVKSYELTNDTDRVGLNFDLVATYRLSEWLGKWKGAGSGSIDDLIPFAFAWTAAPDSIFVRQFKENHLYNLLTPNLSADGKIISPRPDFSSSLVPTNRFLDSRA